MNSLEERIRRGLRADVTVSADDLIAAAAAGAQRTRRQQRWVTGVGAAAVVLAVVVGALAVTRDNANTVRPVGPSPSPTETTTPSVPMVNGRIQSTDEYLGRVGAACDRCYRSGTAAPAFDQATGTLLLIESKVDNSPGIAGVRVVGPDGRVADLACPTDFACPPVDRMSLGPGADEFSVMAHADEVQVLSFDGAVQRGIDLSTVLEEGGAGVGALAWSPDGDRLAVQTGGSGHARIWLVDRDGGGPQLVYTASSTEELPRLAISGTSWSPDGSSLGFVEEHWNMAAEFGRPASEIASTTKAVTILLPDPERGTAGVPRTLYDYPRTHPPDNNPDFDYGPQFLWSPDGARVALTDYDRLLEVSTEDGSILAEHPFVGGDLIWPARQR